QAKKVQTKDGSDWNTSYALHLFGLELKCSSSEAAVSPYELSAADCDKLYPEASTLSPSSCLSNVSFFSFFFIFFSFFSFLSFRSPYKFTCKSFIPSRKRSTKSRLER